MNPRAGCWMMKENEILGCKVVFPFFWSPAAGQAKEKKSQTGKGLQINVDESVRTYGNFKDAFALYHHSTRRRVSGKSRAASPAVHRKSGDGLDTSHVLCRQTRTPRSPHLSSTSSSSPSFFVWSARILPSHHPFAGDDERMAAKTSMGWTHQSDSWNCWLQ